MSLLNKNIMKDLRTIIVIISATLTGTAILLCVKDILENLKIPNWLISSQTMLTSVILLLLSLILLIPLHIIPYIRNKRKNFKHYSKLQIEIAQKILSKDIQSSNDFFLQSYKYDRQHKPFNSSDPNKNYFVSTDPNDAISLSHEFKELIADICKCEYIELETDNTIDIFTYLKKSDYINARNGMDIFHDISMVFQKELKKLIRKKRLPEKI